MIYGIKETIGNCCVDSGQLMICDPCYLESEWDKGQGTFDYAGAGKASMSKAGYGALRFRMGHVGAGVCFSTDGDGSYRISVKRTKDGRIKEVVIHVRED